MRRMPDAMNTNRRTFLQSTMAAGAVGSLPLFGQDTPKADYRGPNLILIRFGGGARRLESIDKQHTYAPYLTHVLAKRGVLFNKMEIDHFKKAQKANGKPVDTSHGQGTIYIMTGSYAKLNNAGGHANHTLFWQMMAPGAGGAPTGQIADAINAALE